MPREIGKIKVTVWADPDWRAITPPAKALYFYLLTNSTLNYAGVSDWRPGRIAPILGCTREDVEQYAQDLQASAFIYVDAETEEAFVRSYVRHDGLLAHAQLPKAMVSAYANISSPAIQRYFVAELHKARSEQPDMKVWNMEQVARILSHDSEDLKEIAYRFQPDSLSIPAGDATDPSRGGSGPSGQERIAGFDTTTTTTTSPKGDAPVPPRRAPERPLPETWEPKEAHKVTCLEKRVDVNYEAQRFRNHAQANDRRQRDWDAAFRNWLINAKPGTTPNGRPSQGSWMAPRKAA